MPFGLVNAPAILEFYELHFKRLKDGPGEAVQKWPQPTTVGELHRFLGFANFYCGFVANFSTISSPLTSMINKHPDPCPGALKPSKLSNS